MDDIGTHGGNAGVWTYIIYDHASVADRVEGVARNGVSTEA